MNYLVGLGMACLAIAPKLSGFLTVIILPVSALILSFVSTPFGWKIVSFVFSLMAAAAVVRAYADLDEIRSQRVRKLCAPVISTLRSLWKRERPPITNPEIPKENSQIPKEKSVDP